jgi:hypothetical protein
MLSAAVAQAESISIEDVRADFDKGEYRAALTKTNKLFSSSLDEPLPSQKFELLMLRGECQLQLKDRLGASTSFKSAAKCAEDVDHLALAKANALIVEKSTMGKYTPTFGASKTPIDILPMDSRKQAMAALQAELWSQNKSQVDAAMKATALPPIEKIFVPLSNMFFLETVAKGEAFDTGKVMRDLGQHAYEMMKGEATRLGRRVEQLNQAANSSADYTGGGGWAGVRAGLSSPQRTELSQAREYLTKLRDRAAEYRGIASKLGGNEQRWDNLVLDVEDILSTAEGLSNDQ